MWYRHKIECIEVFLSRAVDIQDRYTLALESPMTEEIFEHSSDILLGYQDIVFRAVYSELNALIELELKNLARLILEEKGNSPHRLNRGSARSIIETEYRIKLNDLPGFDEVDDLRKIINAYKHDDGYTDTYEEVVPDGGQLFGYRQIQYKLEWDKTYESIQAVRTFMRALPGERQRIRGVRLKREDKATVQTRKNKWEYIRKSGVLGHQLEKSVATNDERVVNTAICGLCGKLFQAKNKEMIYILAMADRDNCPGVPELNQ